MKIMGAENHSGCHEKYQKHNINEWSKYMTDTLPIDSCFNADYSILYNINQVETRIFWFTCCLVALVKKLLLHSHSQL